MTSNTNRTSSEINELFHHLQTDFHRFQTIPKDIERYANLWVNLTKWKYKLYKTFMNYSDQDKINNYESFVSNYSHVLEKEVHWYDIFETSLDEQIKLLDSWHRDIGIIKSFDSHIDASSIKKMSKQLNLVSHALKEISSFFSKSDHRMKKEQQLLKKYHSISVDKFSKQLEKISELIVDESYHAVKLAHKEHLSLERYKGKIYDTLVKDLHQVDEINALYHKGPIRLDLIAGLAAAAASSSMDIVDSLQTAILLSLFVGIGVFQVVGMVTKTFEDLTEKKMKERI